MTKNLPYHCPTFRTDHLLEPCTKNLARVKYLKLAKKHIGPLEKCVECKVKMLVTVPLPNKSLEEGRLSTEEEAMVIHPAIPEPPKYVSPERKGWESHPEVTTAPLFLRDLGVRELEMRPLSPEAIVQGRAAVKRLGEKAVWGRELSKKEEILPELPIVVIGERLRPVEAAEMVQVKPEVLEQRVLEGKVPPIILFGARYCPTHPESLQRVDSLGRYMGMCQECLVARGRKAGIENSERGITAPPVSIPLNLPRYSEIKKWLEDQADQNERTLQKEIMMVLKTAWRQGT